MIESCSDQPFESCKFILCVSCFRNSFLSFIFYKCIKEKIILEPPRFLLRSYIMSWRRTPPRFIPLIPSSKRRNGLHPDQDSEKNILQQPFMLTAHIITLLDGEMGVLSLWFGTPRSPPILPAVGRGNVVHYLLIFSRGGVIMLPGDRKRSSEIISLT